MSMPVTLENVSAIKVIENVALWTGQTHRGIAQAVYGKHCSVQVGLERGARCSRKDNFNYSVYTVTRE